MNRHEIEAIRDTIALLEQVQQAEGIERDYVTQVRLSCALGKLDALMEYYHFLERHP